MAYDTWPNTHIEMQKKSVVNHFKNPIEAMVTKEKCEHTAYDTWLWGKSE